MNIALLGYGRMGKVIEQIAIERGHSVVLKINDSNESIDLSNADVAIDFSIPSAAVKNITNCIDQSTPVISGTTGWLEDYDNVVEYCISKQGAFIYGSNFSLGVNIFFELNKQLARMMSKLSDYNVTREEIHHTKKLDAPSGTAITLADDIIGASDNTSWSTDESKHDNDIPIVVKRIEQVPGTHVIDYTSEVDSIEIKHTAHNRQGFALGAVIAAEWLQNKTGVYSMKDVLGIKP